MIDLLETIATYVPPSIIRQVLRDPTPGPPTGAVVERFPAAVLFADVSGFAPLTEALAQKGSEGPEELTRLLNGYFSRMIAIIEAGGGEVVKFSGDALTAVFRAETESLGTATRRAWQTATAMQAAMTEFATLTTSVGPVALGMKIGIGAGDLLSAQVGGGQGHWEYVIAGDPLGQVAQAEHQAQRGEIILSPEAQNLIVPDTIPPRPLEQPDWDDVYNLGAVEKALRAFVPQAILAWLAEELQDWLAVLRPMTVLFIGIEGIDYGQTDAIDRLHAALRAAQETIVRYEGNINKLAVDDKGTILLALFGAPPYAHEDDPERALRCALELQAIAATQNLQLAIGITSGRVFAGPVGSITRREYTVMGDAVNLAARLMSIAGPGQIRCDYETYRWARQHLAFDSLPSVGVKGKAGLIRVYRPIGEAQSKQKKQTTTGRLIGRLNETARLTTIMDDVQARRNHPYCLLIEGEAGIGKSRLVEELIQLMRGRGIAGLKGMGRSIEQHTPYRAWRDVFSFYFDIDEIDDPTERRRRVERQINDAAPDMIERLPLLNDVLSLGFPENDLTASLDAHLRHESLVSLLMSLIYAWAADRPLVLVVEDAHWLDSLSWDLTLQILRGLSVFRASLLLVLVMRRMQGDTVRTEANTLAALDSTEKMTLTALSSKETLTLAATKLGLDDDLPEDVATLVRTRAGGNPFFAEELVYALRDGGLIAIEVDKAGRRKCVVRHNLAQAAQKLPDTIEGIVLSRIDRLPPEEQLALKVAAVIGRTFAYLTLHGTLDEHMEISHQLLTGYLDDLAQQDLTPLEAIEPELTYIFKHIIIQEVAYETLLFAQRRQLHTAVARWYERKLGQEENEAAQLESPLAPYYPLLAYHWRRAQNEERERIYARLAGQWAAAQFANEEAAGYFSRALALTPETDVAARTELLLAREAVNDLRGEREAQAQDLATLTSLVAGQDGRRRAEVALRQANYYETVSDYKAALETAHQAVTYVIQSQDTAGETEAYIAWGRVLWQQGDYEIAREKLSHALTLAHTNQYPQSEAKSLNTLGHVHLFQGDFPAAEGFYRQALEIYRTGGERQGEADNLSNLGVIYSYLGDYPAARDHDEQALAIYQAIGDRRGETIVLSNLGVIYCDMGDYEMARDYHQRALEIRLIIGDRQGEATSLVNLGLVNHGLGDNKASRYNCEQALRIQQAIEDRRGQGYSLTYLGHALTELGDLEAAANVYTQAMTLRRELGQDALAIDDLAGLARVVQAQGDRSGARTHVQRILDWIEENGADGIEYPLQVYWTCYQILANVADGDTAVRQQADTLLAQTHAEMTRKATSIQDETLRQKFLENVATHRAISAAWEGRRATPP